MLLVAIGCSQKPDPRIGKLEARVTEVEAGYKDLHERFTNLCEMVISFNSTNQYHVEALAQLVVQSTAEWEKVGRLMDEIQGSLTNTPAPTTAPRLSKFAAPTQQPKSARPSTVMKRGVPLSVYEKIEADASHRWGTDFQMQKYEIDKQIEAYLKLHPN